MTPLSTRPSAASVRLLWIPPALLLIAAAIAKAQNPLTFLLELSNYGFNLAPDLEALLALILPGLEMLLGAALLFRFSRWAAILSILLLLFFSSAILVALPSGYLHGCGCLGPERINPTSALIKNGVAIAFLIAGFLPLARRAQKINPWGAFGAATGATFSYWGLLIIMAATAIVSLASGRRSIFAYLGGLALGIALHASGFPLISVIVVGFVLYLFPVEEHRADKHTVPVLTGLIGFACLFALLYAPEPSLRSPALQVGKPIPRSLEFAAPILQDGAGRSLLLFLQPDCDECRDWLPAASALARRPEIPPLTAIIPGSGVSADEFREKEGIAFDIRTVSSASFGRMARRTPLLVLLESDSVRQIYAEGMLPRSSDLEQELMR
jgi:hypothetical protein